MNHDANLNRLQQVLQCCLCLGLGAAATAADSWLTLPPERWQGRALEAPGLPGRHHVTLAFPPAEASALTVTSATSLAPGQYRVRLTVRPSHVAAAIAFNTQLIALADGQRATFDGILFARTHQPEVRTFEVIHRRAGPLQVQLQAETDAEVCRTAFAAAATPIDGPQGGTTLLAGADDELGLGLDELEFALSPDKAVYVILDRAEVQLLSPLAAVANLEIDKIRYRPGAALHGSVDIVPLQPAGSGTLRILLEQDPGNAREVWHTALTLAEVPQTIRFEVTLPELELGYALCAEFSDESGHVSRAQACFTVADNFYRVAIHGGADRLDEDRQRAAFTQMRENYQNCTEIFAWAEEDMVEMSPETDWWFSGQTNYHMNRDTLQRYTRLAHEQGIAVVTYGKFVMSGYLGWRTAYDYPHDHRWQYYYPVGMWEGTSVTILDRFRNKEFVPYAYRPTVPGDNPWDVWWQHFMPINPDATPRMTRIAAEEIIRSIEMFGWDGVRWDGHPRGGGPTGGAPGKYDALASRRTQTLVRYFKDIVNQRYPRFRHGYNYLLVQPEPQADWAPGDFELDELCRGGGLLMNESIRNSEGKTFEWIARNIQVEGDLCRERGGFLLGISVDGAAVRDRLIEAILYAAGGCRPMGAAAGNKWVNRYATRFAQYTFDETLRRLTDPEKLLQPSQATALWWQPFVYLSQRPSTGPELIVNLLNLPRDARPSGEGARRISWQLNEGSEPVAFTFSLPADHKLDEALLIDPFTLAVTNLAVSDGAVNLPSIAIWQVLVARLRRMPGAPPLTAMAGTLQTIGKPRGDDPADVAELTLDIAKPVVEVNKDMSVLAPAKSAGTRPDLAQLSAAERNQQLLQRRAEFKPEKLLGGWWQGGSLPADLALQANPPQFQDLTPQRNGRFDIQYGRGPMDYRLRFAEIFAGLPRFRIHDAPLTGVLRQRPGMRLEGGLGWRQFPSQDLLLYTGIPHCAIGVANAYALLRYVEAGGAVLFTGGEYAFGKGGYSFTVLERELLPVVSVETVDVCYADSAMPLEPGPALAELGVSLDFTAGPVFWLYNEVAVKPEAEIRIFLQSGNLPILFGWHAGKGRGACLMLDHRGKSSAELTMFFDWQDWPRLMQGLLRWLVPDSGAVSSPVPLTAAALQQTRDLLEDTGFVDLAVADGPDLLSDAGGPEAAGNELDTGKRAELVAAVNRAVDADATELAGLLASQLADVSNLPFATQSRILDFLRRHPPANIEQVAAGCLDRLESGISGCGYQLLAIAGSPELIQAVTSPAAVLTVNLRDRQRYLALAIAQFQADGLVAAGRARVAEWNRQEAEIWQKWTGDEPFSLRRPAHPGLDAEASLARVAWLAYLSRFEPDLRALQLAREWLMTAQYEDYCERSIGNLWGMNMSNADKRRANTKTPEWRHLKQCFARLRELTEADLQRLLATSPAAVAEGFAGAHFVAEVRTCINFLGNYQAVATRQVLARLCTASQPDLAAFARARLADAGPRPEP